MQEHFVLRLVNYVLCVPDGVVEFFGNLSIGQPINKPALEHPPVTLAVDVFINHCDDLAVGVFLHFFTFTLPVPWQTLHFLKPVLPPVFRTRLLVTVCRAICNHPASADIVVHAGA